MLTNYGTIISNGTANNAEPIEVVGTGNTIINHGTIQAVRSGLNAIFFQPGGSNSVINYGTIQVSGSTTSAINGGLVVDFTNYGTVIGSLNFSVGGGNDILRLYTGQTVTGSIDGGSGTNNQLFLNGTGSATLGPVTNFQTITKQGSGIWTLTGAWTGVTTTSVIGGTLAVGGAGNPGASLASTNVVVTQGGRFGGYGSVTGNVINGNNGTVAAGNAIPEFAGGPRGNFTINGSLANAGTVNLAGTGVPGNQVTVNGNYRGFGNAALNVRTVLAGDGSPSDKLVISGGTGTGTTRIGVTNAGGTGALTTGDGILVVQAINGATTTANAFNLGRSISAGPYDYFLFRGGVSPGTQDSWYLRSSLVPGPTPSPGGPPLPPAGGLTPLYRPEVAVQSAVPSTALTPARVAVGTFNERQGDQLLLRGDRAPGVWGRVFGQQTREHFAQGAQPEFYGTYAAFRLAGTFCN